MKKKIVLTLFLLIFIMVISKVTLAATIYIGEETTIQLADLTENGKVPYKIASAGCSDESIINIEQIKTKVGLINITTSIKITGKKVGTTTLNISSYWKNTITDPMTGTISQRDELMSKAITVEVKDKAQEAEERQNKYEEELKNAYKTIPDINADAKTIATFVKSDSKYNNGNKLKSLSIDITKQWKDTIQKAMIDAVSREAYKPVYTVLGEHEQGLEMSMNAVNEQTNKDINAGQQYVQSLKTDSGNPRGNIVFNDVLTDLNTYKPTDLEGEPAHRIEIVASRILTIITNIGVAVSVIMLATLGIKYMLGSVEEKAEYKQSLIPYVVGAFILFGITGFVKILIIFGNLIAGI